MNIIIILYFIDMYSIKDKTIEFVNGYNEVVDIQKVLANKAIYPEKYRNLLISDFNLDLFSRYGFNS